MALAAIAVSIFEVDTSPNTHDQVGGDLISDAYPGSKIIQLGVDGGPVVGP